MAVSPSFLPRSWTPIAVVVYGGARRRHPSPLSSRPERGADIHRRRGVPSGARHGRPSPSEAWHRRPSPSEDGADELPRKTGNNEHVLWRSAISLATEGSGQEPPELRHGFLRRPAGGRHRAGGGATEVEMMRGSC